MKPNTKYFIYIIGGSLHPGYPDLMPGEFIKIKSIKTKPEII